MKVYMTPSPSTAPTDNGIGRILHAMEKKLPEYGVTFTENIEQADIVAVHAGTAPALRVDVLHCHGLYWNDLDHSEFSRSHSVSNSRILAAARRAKKITVPSDWVAEPFRRDMRINPQVIGHGIDVKEWNPSPEVGNYILWNKNRPSDVCDPTPAWRLAERGLRVISTFAPYGKIPSYNMTIVGQLPFVKMKPFIEQAELYLATAPETFGIGTLEAMVCGVPVLGYDWCGTHDLIRHKETGWLTPVGDIDGLLEGARWLQKHRRGVGANAREFARRFDWSSIIGTYYALYEDILTQPNRSGISIVITNHNYSHWVRAAIHSCLNQTLPPDEIIVVDDGSTDDSLAVLAQEKSIRLISQENQGVAAARNNGIKAAKHEYILCLDADDMIAPDYLRALYPALERDRGLGIAYTGLAFMREDGLRSGSTTYKPFDWEIQTRQEVPPPTCIPSGSLFRKEMWERCGGYRQKYAPGEDTEFWVRGLATGFTAELVTPEALFWYRVHGGSASRTRTYVAIDDNKPWIKDKQYPMAAPSLYAPPVRSYLQPVVTVIIPVGPKHETLVEDAIESVIGQTLREWELILINDSGHQIPSAYQYPFVRYYVTTGGKGAGFARNIGIKEARGQFVLFLDADDWLRKDALARMLQMHADTGLYAFSDFYEVGSRGTMVWQHVMDYNQTTYRDKQVMHSVTALVPTLWAREAGGFDATLVGWEEYDFYMKLALAGRCGVRIPDPLFYYRANAGTRRKDSYANKDKLLAIFSERYEGKEMSGCCGNAGSSILEAKRAMGLLPPDPSDVILEEGANEVRMEFTGTWLGPVAFQVNGRTYYGARDDLHRFINAPREDVDKLVASGKWRIIRPNAIPIEEPAETLIVAEPAPQRRG